MSLNIIAKSQGIKKGSFLGDRRYNVRDIDRYRYFGKTNYTPTAIGSESLTNGNFSGNANSWSLAVIWTYNNNAIDIVYTGQGGDANAQQQPEDQAVALIIGETYMTTYTISNYVAGSVHIRVGSGTAGTIRSANGTYVEDLVCTTNRVFLVQKTSGVNPVTLTVDAISCRTLGILDQTVSIGATEDVDITSVFTDKDLNRLGSSLIYTAQSDDDTKGIALIIGDNVRLIGIAAGTPTITITAKDLFSNTVSTTFTLTVS